MERVKYLALVVVAVAACLGVIYAYEGVSNLYGDWVFVRALRVRALQQQADRQQPPTVSQTPRPAAPATPAAAGP